MQSDHCYSLIKGERTVYTQPEDFPGRAMSFMSSDTTQLRGNSITANQPYLKPSLSGFQLIVEGAPSEWLLDLYNTTLFAHLEMA